MRMEAFDINYLGVCLGAVKSIYLAHELILVVQGVELCFNKCSAGILMKTLPWSLFRLCVFMYKVFSILPFIYHFFHFDDVDNADGIH